MSDIGDQIERGSDGPEWERVGPFLPHDATERIEELSSEVARLNEMLRKTGYGQGQIDSYAAECERADKAESESQRRLDLLRRLEWSGMWLDQRCCPVCGGMSHDAANWAVNASRRIVGHESYCELAKELE